MSDAEGLWEPQNLWRTDEPLTDEQARAVLAGPVGLPADVVERMTGDQVRDTVDSVRALIRRLTASGETDELTGAIVRGAGLASLRREIARIERTQGRLVLAFIDVDGLKGVNDSHGHLAGDRLLKDVVASLRAQLRSYDLVIRFAGDEFVCALMDTDLNDVRSRFSAVEALFASRTGGRSMSVGLTEFSPGDTVEDLIGRADAAMYRSRRRRRN